MHKEMLAQAVGIRLRHLPSRTPLHDFTFQLGHFSAVRLQANYLTYLCLSFLIAKVRIIISML